MQYYKHKPIVQQWTKELARNGERMVINVSFNDAINTSYMESYSRTINRVQGQTAHL